MHGSFDEAAAAERTSKVALADFVVVAGEHVQLRLFLGIVRRNWFDTRDLFVEGVAWPLVPDDIDGSILSGGSPDGHAQYQ